MAIDQTQVLAERGLRRYDLVSPALLDALSNFHNDRHPVVSVYLDVPPGEKKKDELRTRLNHFLDERHKEQRQESKASRRAFQTEAEHLLSWLENEYDETGRGLAIFSSQDQLWRVFRLPLAVRDQLVVADRPYLRPLFTLADEYERYLVLLVNKQIARLFVVYLGEIEEHAELADELVPNPKSGEGGAVDKNQRSHEMHVLWHVKRAVEVTERLCQREHCQWLVIGGTPEPLSQLREQLPKALRERLAGEISVAVEAPPNRILEAVLAIEQENERRVEAQRVDALLTAALGKGPGVLGLDDTLEAIVEGRVLTLLVEQDLQHAGFECPNDQYLVARKMVRCPYDGSPLDAQADIVERAIERAFEQGAAIEVVRGPEREQLAVHGHIGALLRYNIGASATDPGKPVSTR